MISIIKYNAGNIRSVAFTLERLNVSYVITDNPEDIRKADKVIFPGVGEANTTMNYLKDRKLDLLIKELKQPVLGICLGMQLLCACSEENDTPCIGIFDEPVKRFQPKKNEKVPHMGWNSLTPTQSWMDTSLTDQFVYFVHSYYVPVNAYTSAITEYTQPFSAAMRKDNFFAVQFHPEKSAEAGEKILSLFLNQV
ncbi:MAG: imidazole glycerol phosphate synthase subunit HisH [Cyclobacteriaceae bacterium]|nr:imidazole glycerol phosphate synthase subunit HisH [Cyclobacteriaceae bacterium]